MQHELNRNINGSHPAGGIARTTTSSPPAAASAARPTMMNDLELAAWLGISRKTLQKWRSLGMGPPYLKFGTKVVYRAEDIEAYIQRCLHRHK